MLYMLKGVNLKLLLFILKKKLRTSSFRGL